MSQNKPQIPNQGKYTQPNVAISQQTLQIQQFSGPLPSPEVLTEYAKIYPGLEKTIVEMALAQNTHRIEIEKIVILSREKQSRLGQYFAFVVAILLIALAAVALFLGHPTVAGVVATTTIASTIALFLKAKSDQTPQKNEKSNSK